MKFKMPPFFSKSLIALILINFINGSSASSKNIELAIAKDFAECAMIFEIIAHTGRVVSLSKNKSISLVDDDIKYIENNSNLLVNSSLHFYKSRSNILKGFEVIYNHYYVGDAELNMIRLTAANENNYKIGWQINNKQIDYDSIVKCVFLAEAIGDNKIKSRSEVVQIFESSLSSYVDYKNRKIKSNSYKDEQMERLVRYSFIAWQDSNFKSFELNYIETKKMIDDIIRKGLRK